MNYKRLVILHGKLLSEVVDWLEIMRGEWAWKRNEPRAGNKEEYNKLCDIIYNVKVLQKFTKEKLEGDKK